MIPNVLPILVVFGGMAWLDYPVSIGSMMAASIALGVAVDDTIHYLTWFRDDLRRTATAMSAILVAYRRCGTPTLQAALDQRPGIVGIRGQHVHADSRIRPADVDDLAGRRRGRTDHDAGLAGRSPGNGLRTTSVPRRVVSGCPAWCDEHAGPPHGRRRRELTIPGRFRRAGGSHWAGYKLRPGHTPRALCVTPVAGFAPGPR